MRMWFLIFLVFVLITSNTASSQTVETLPGFDGKLPFTLETGYVGVGDSESVQLFYYFIESERNPDEDPLVLWLTGGPGCSVLSGILYEVGPFSFDYAKSSTGTEKVPTLKLNPYSWTKVSNMLFVDAPVGTGFSYATNLEAYEISDSSSSAQTYEFLRKWLLSHPRFLKNPLYISGDSYSGIVLPMIVKKISDGNDAGYEPQLNLKGYSLGNPAADQSIYQSNDMNWRIVFAHRMGLISDKLYESTKGHCHGEYTSTDASNTACIAHLQTVSHSTRSIYISNIVEPTCASDQDAIDPKPVGPSQRKLSQWDASTLQEDSMELLNARQQSTGRWCRNKHYFFAFLWANDEVVQTALHVRKGTKQQGWSRCNDTLFSVYNFNVESSVPYHKNLTERGYKVLIYSGDRDLICPHVGTYAWIKSLKLTETRKWNPWYVEGQVAGYTVEYTHNNHSIVYATVKGAGHTAPEYKPVECFAMFSRWLAHSPL